MGRRHEGQRHWCVGANGGKVQYVRSRSDMGKECDGDLRGFIVDAKPLCVLQGRSNKALDLHGDQGEKALGHLLQRTPGHPAGFHSFWHGTLGK